MPSRHADHFLASLAAEEQALRAATAAAADLHAALRRGDLSGFDRPALEVAAADLQTTTAARNAAAAPLAEAVGLPAAGLTLSALADRLPDPWAAETRAARDRLSGVAAELADLHRRNANLACHLRSYFRGVLSELTAADAPGRYGRSGGWMAPAGGSALTARG